jgi:hypothetical protein
MNKPNQWRAAARSVQQRRHRERLRRAVEHREQQAASEQVRLLVR